VISCTQLASFHRSQNHRIAEVGRDLWRSTSSAPLLEARSPAAGSKRRSPTAGCSGLAPVKSWWSPRMKTPLPPWLTCASIQSSSMFNWHLRYFCLCPSPLPSCPFTGYHGEKPGSVFSPSDIYTHWSDLLEPSLLQTEQSQLSQPLLIQQMLQSLNHLCGPLLDSLQHVSLVLGSPELDPAFQMLFLKHARVLLPLFATRAHCSLMFNLVSTRSPGSFTAKLLSSWSAPSMRWCMGLFLPRRRTLHFSLWNLEDASQPISPACPGPFEWQRSYLIYQPFHPVLR